MDTISVVDVAAQIEAEFDRLKVARPALFSRISRAENILVTHLSCPKASIIRPRIRGGELVAYLVKGSGGAVYRVEPGTFSCSCPDYHRSGLTGCKHGIACYALGRAFRPSSVHHGRHQQVGRRCDTDPSPKNPRHASTGVGEQLFTGQESGGSTIVEREQAASTSYGPATCSQCLGGQTYDGQRGEWVACERCEGSGRVLAFLYERAKKRLSECAGCGERYPHRELVEVTEDHESLTWFPGDRLCVRECASGHGVL